MKETLEPDHADAPVDVAIVLARYLAEDSVRNSILENLHAGRVPNSKSGDYSDVVVQTPTGKIPWPNLSRISDREMRALMLDIEMRLARCLRYVEDFRNSSEFDVLLNSIRERSFGKAGVSWDRPKDAMDK